MKRQLIVLVFFVLGVLDVAAQGVGIPSKRGGIGFGNLPHFTGVRLNAIDRNVEQINGVNVTVWQPKNEGEQTGDMNGISIGLPMAMGLENQRGVSVGILGAGAKNNLSGINIGGLGVGAGGTVTGLNIGGLGVGSGGGLTGINIAALGVGSGGDVRGFNFGGLGVGGGGSLSGINIGGLGVGSGGNVSGFSFGGLGVGSGGDLTGVSVSLVGVGAGGRVRGINLAGVAIGSGEEVQGIAIAGVGIGGPSVKGLAIALAVGGAQTTGIMIAPAFFRVGGSKGNDGEESTSGLMKGISISAYNRIMGEQRGVAIGVVNYTRKIKGAQFGLINIVRENPKGLRVLPFFNTRFGKKG